ncbi:hypothetical protein QFZ64_006993 [Streptomyces sp. B3I8]|nr:hypothetical protein [Streptomyces sp. B3I8]
MIFPIRPRSQHSPAMPRPPRSWAISTVPARCMRVLDWAADEAALRDRPCASIGPGVRAA